MTSPRAEQQHRETFFSVIGQHLGRLYHEVQHRLAELEAIGDLLPGELTADDVVDAVVLRASRAFAKNPDERRLGSRLLETAREYLAAEVKRLKEWRRRTPVHIEEDIPETPPTEAVSRLGEEILEFYEPDEDLKLEDVIPDLKIPTPEQEAERRELRVCVSAALAGLPRQWRRALLLRHVEGRGPAELASALGTAEPEVERVLDHARHYLRQRLLESGCVVDG